MIGTQIGELLKRKNIKQIAFAEMIGFTTKHVSNIVNNKVVLDVEVLQEIARVLETPVSYFFGETTIDDHSVNMQQGENSAQINVSGGSGSAELNYNSTPKLDDGIQEIVDMMEDYCSKKDLDKIRDFLNTLKASKDTII